MFAVQRLIRSGARIETAPLEINKRQQNAQSLPHSATLRRESTASTPAHSPVSYIQRIGGDALRDAKMRLLTWNVNAIVSVLNYNPFNLVKTYEAMFEILDADICCIQEHKITAAQLTAAMAAMPSYDSFFSFYRRSVRGIHGTAIFTKRSVTVPLKAEEGLSSTLIPTTTTERIGGYPSISDIDITLDEMQNIDLEGRTTVCDFGMFVLINVYCPCPVADDAQRTKDKNQFNMVLNERARSLIRAGRQVIVVGDLNISHSGLNTEEEDKTAKRGRWSGYAPEQWLAEFVGSDGVMIDITRKFHPTRLAMNTCWETKTNSRPGNLGARIDYILVTPGLLPWIKNSDIMTQVMGSDHCPVFVDFHDEIEIEGRGIVKLWDEMNPGRSVDDEIPPPPAFATRNLDQFSGKQKRLSNYFVAKSGAPSGSASPLLSPQLPSTASTSSSVIPTAPSVVPRRIPLGERSIADSLAIINTPSSAKPVTKKGKEKEAQKQRSIDSFLKPPVVEPKSKSTKKKVKKAQSPIIILDSSPPPESRSQSPAPSTSASSTTDGLSVIDLAEATPMDMDAMAAFVALFKKPKAPNCYVHDEPSTLWTTNKSGANRGRVFYLCSRMVGPDYDKGWSKEKGAQKVVNPEFRCNFFLWDTSVKRPAGMILSSADKKKKKKS